MPELRLLLLFLLLRLVSLTFNLFSARVLPLDCVSFYTVRGQGFALLLRLFAL
jgi:hypothetical protein